MTPQFRMSRFSRVLRWLFTYESRKLWNLFLLAIVLFAGFDTYAMYYNVDAYASPDTPLSVSLVMRSMKKIGGVSLLLLTFYMWVGATFAFSTLHRKHTGRQLLMLPATNLEKFLALWVIYVPVLFVCLIVAFVVGDLARMIILPLFIEHGSLPSAIPAFFSQMWDWLTLHAASPGNLRFMIRSWVLILMIHALSLFYSALAGYLGWLLTGITVYAGTYLFINTYGQSPWHAPFLLLLAVVLLLMAYRLFCRYPLFKSLIIPRFHDIQFR